MKIRIKKNKIKETSSVAGGSIQGHVDIRKEELKQMLDEMERRGFLKSAAAMCALGIQSACKQDYEIHNAPDRNLYGMKVPDCIGEIRLAFLGHDFDAGPIPEDFFINTYRDMGVEVKKDTGRRVGLDDYEGIDYTIRIVFRNVPEGSDSWDEIELRNYISNPDLSPERSYYWSTQENRPYLIRSPAFYFPVKNNMVYASKGHFEAIERGSSSDSWKKIANWNFTFPFSVPDEENPACEEEFHKFMEGPLEDPEAELNEMYSSAGIMGTGSGRIPADRSPEGHKRYVRIRFTRQGLQNFKPNRYFAEKKDKKGASPSYCKSTPCSEMGFTQKASCKSQGLKDCYRGKKKN